MPRGASRAFLEVSQKGDQWNVAECGSASPSPLARSRTTVTEQEQSRSASSHAQPLRHHQVGRSTRAGIADLARLRRLPFRKKLDRNPFCAALTFAKFRFPSSSFRFDVDTRCSSREVMRRVVVQTALWGSIARVDISCPCRAGIHDERTILPSLDTERPHKYARSLSTMILLRRRSAKSTGRHVPAPPTAAIAPDEEDR